MPWCMRRRGIWASYMWCVPCARARALLALVLCSLICLAQDLFGREGKFGGSAHFTIRGAKQLRSQAGGDFQRPIVLLAMNFGGETVDSGDGGSDGGGEVVLSWHEWETLYHEFGHALHSLLSRTSYQHLSGDTARRPRTRCVVVRGSRRMPTTFACRLQGRELPSTSLRCLRTLSNGLRASLHCFAPLQVRNTGLVGIA
jgi:hypothetical protein